MIDASAALVTALRLAREAGDRILEVRKGGALGVRDKGHNNPVTAADFAANEVIVPGLSAAFPDAVIVSEENDASTYAHYRDAEACFFVDPLDGTKDFIRGGGDFCVMIGLVVKGEPIMGVIVVPATGEAAYATRGFGAFADLGDGNARALRFDVARAAKLEDATVLVSSAHRSDAVDARLAALGARELVARGSVGVKALHVCLGRADAYVHPASMAGKRWDVAAPEAIVREAGGRLCDASGAAFDYRAASLDNAGILCGSSAIIDAVVATLARVPA